jgi:hypothetical protein
VHHAEKDVSHSAERRIGRGGVATRCRLDLGSHGRQVVSHGHEQRRSLGSFRARQGGLVVGLGEVAAGGLDRDLGSFSVAGIGARIVEMEPGSPLLRGGADLLGQVDALLVPGERDRQVA